MCRVLRSACPECLLLAAADRMLTATETIPSAALNEESRHPFGSRSRPHGATETGGRLHKPSASKQNNSQTNSNEINVSLSEESILPVSLWILFRCKTERPTGACFPPWYWYRKRKPISARHLKRSFSNCICWDTTFGTRRLKDGGVDGAELVCLELNWLLE